MIATDTTGLYSISTLEVTEMAALRGVILGHLVCVLVSLVDGVANDGTSGLTLADKQSLLDEHNTARAGVSPTATDMKKMVRI